MSDTEETQTPVAVEEEETPQEMDVNTALQQVLKKALIHDGLARGLHEVAKVLSRGAHLCVLSQNCEEEGAKRLVEGLCKEQKINFIKVPDSKQLGEWAGLCKIDKEGKPRKVVACSCVAVKDYGEKSDALDFLLEYFKNNQA
eukprot:GFYU01000320.1.p1 GENE.GFYU01000320.1~~GFYU01000320.1.p1  ORF type:complete len:165 (+),score=51.95 GFYU01000320.1:69-497(+)